MNFYPELPYIRLGFGIRCPIVATVLILATELAIVTTCAVIDIDYKAFIILHPPYKPDM
jgi:hypothetical protein